MFYDKCMILVSLFIKYRCLTLIFFKKMMKYENTRHSSWWNIEINDSKHGNLITCETSQHLTVSQLTINSYYYIITAMLNSWPIDEVGKGALGMVEPRYEPRAEHAGIHGNPESGNHQALSHWQSQWRYLPTHVLSVTSQREGGKEAKALHRHKWHSKANCTFYGGP